MNANVNVKLIFFMPVVKYSYQSHLFELVSFASGLPGYNKAFSIISLHCLASGLLITQKKPLEVTIICTMSL